MTVPTVPLTGIEIGEEASGAPLLCHAIAAGAAHRSQTALRMVAPTY